MIRLTKSDAEAAVKLGVSIKRTKHGVYAMDVHSDAG